MKTFNAALLAAACLSLGMGVGYAAKAKGPGLALFTGKPAKEAAVASLQEAEKLAKGGSWELIAIARAYYLSGDKPRGQALIDKVLAGEAESGDWFRIARLYAEAGENDKAEQFYQRALTADPKDDSGQAELAAFYFRMGKRDLGEEWLGKAFSKNSDEVWHYVHAAEGLLNVQAN